MVEPKSLKEISDKGLKIRLGRLKAELPGAKRRGDAELGIKIQSNIEDVKREMEERAAFLKSNPPVPAASAAPAPAVGGGLSPEEARLAAGAIIGTQNKILSAIAGRKFEMDISEGDRQGMEGALCLSAAKRLTPEKKEKLDLLFLGLAFLAPFIAALPLAMAAAKSKKKIEETSPVKTDAVAVEVGKVTISEPSTMEGIAGPMPPPAGG